MKWPSPQLVQFIAVLGIIDAILTLIIESYDIIYQNGNIYNSLLEIIGALLEFLPYTQCPNAEKIKNIVCIDETVFSKSNALFDFIQGQKGSKFSLAFQAMMEPMKKNPNANDIAVKMYEVISFFNSFTTFKNEVYIN